MGVRRHRRHSASSGWLWWRASIARRRSIRGCRPRNWPTSAAIRPRPTTPDRRGATLLPHRQTWAFAVGKFMTDPIWWLYLFWIPDFLNRNHGLDLKSIGLPLVVIYLMADVGSIGGGWLSSALIKRGWTRQRGAQDGDADLRAGGRADRVRVADARTCGWPSLLVSLAAAAHQGWSANLFTLTSDMFPRRAVGSVVGIGGMAGAIGGMLIALVVGEILAAHRQLRADLPHRRLRLSGRAGHRPPARAAARSRRRSTERPTVSPSSSSSFVLRPSSLVP